MLHRIFRTSIAASLLITLQVEAGRSIKFKFASLADQASDESFYIPLKPIPDDSTKYKGGWTKLSLMKKQIFTNYDLEVESHIQIFKSEDATSSPVFRIPVKSSIKRGVLLCAGATGEKLKFHLFNDRFPKERAMMVANFSKGPIFLKIGEDRRKLKSNDIFSVERSAGSHKYQLFKRREDDLECFRSSSWLFRDNVREFLIFYGAAATHSYVMDYTSR